MLPYESGIVTRIAPMINFRNEDQIVKDWVKVAILSSIDPVAPYSWQPIETVPKDAHSVDLWVVSCCFGRERGMRYPDCYWSSQRGKWMKGGYEFETDGIRITHWIRIGTPTPIKKEEA